MAQEPEPTCTASDLFAGIFAAIAAPPALQRMIKMAAERLDEKDRTIADLREKMAGMVTIPDATGGAFFGYSSSRFVTSIIRESNIDSAQGVLEQIADRAWKAGHEKGQEGGQTRVEIKQAFDRIEELRKAANLSPTLTSSAVLREIQNLLGLRAMGDALTRSGFVREPEGEPKNCWEAIAQASRLLRQAATQAKGKKIPMESPEGRTIALTFEAAQALYLQTTL